MSGVRRRSPGEGKGGSASPWVLTVLPRDAWEGAAPGLAASPEDLGGPLRKSVSALASVVPLVGWVFAPK